MANGYIELNDREKMVIRLRNKDNTYDKIGQIIGVSTARARQIYFRAIRKKKMQSDMPWFYGLSPKTIHCVVAAGCNSKNDVIALLQRHILYPGRIRGYGRKTHAEVCDWAGYSGDGSEGIKYREIICPHCGVKIELDF